MRTALALLVGFLLSLQPAFAYRPTMDVTHENRQELEFRISIKKAGDLFFVEAKFPHKGRLANLTDTRLRTFRDGTMTLDVKTGLKAYFLTNKQQDKFMSTLVECRLSADMLKSAELFLNCPVNMRNGFLYRIDLSSFPVEDKSSNKSVDPISEPAPERVSSKGSR